MTLQTLQANVGIGEQLFVLKENGQYLPVTPTPGVPGGGAGPAPIAGVDDGSVALAGSGANAGLLVYLKGVATSVLSWSVSAAAWVAAGVAPFKGTYYVDPGFVGLSTGSQSNPFTSYAAAFAFAAGLGITNGIIFQAPGTNAVENVTFPLTGEWELAAQPGQAGLTEAVITGNIDISASASARRALTNLRMVGNLTGNCSAGTQRILCSGTTVTGTTTLTATGAGVQRLATRSGTSAAAAGGNVQACFFQGATSIAGTYWGSDAIFSVSLSVTATSSFSFCDLPPTISSTGATALFMTNCTNTVGGSLAFTATSGTMQLRPDYATLSELQRVGTVLTGAVSIQGLTGRSSVSVQPSNVGNTFISGILPAGLQVMEACLTLLTNVGGTTAGNASLNVIYTDATGTLVTESVATLNVGGAIGSKARGSLPFSQNGATAVLFSVTGITNATGLTYELDVAVRQAS